MANGNGTHHWTLERDPLYVEDCRRLEAEHPRGRLAIAAVERLLERLPTFNAEALPNDLWLYITLAGFGAPRLAVWYSVRLAGPRSSVHLL